MLRKCQCQSEKWTIRTSGILSRSRSPMAAPFDEWYADEMEILPLSDSVVVRSLENQGAPGLGGLFISGASRETSILGVVTEVGPGRRDAAGDLIPVSISVGDHVIFDKYSGTVLTFEGNRWNVLRADEILCVVR